MSDDELVRRSKRGERQAFEELVRRYQSVAFRTGWIIVRDEAEAEDAAQSAFLKAWLALDRFRDGAPFRPWLLQIVANEAKNQRKVTHRTRVAEVDDAVVADPASLEGAVVDRERASWLVAHINHLAEPDRMVIYCRYALELSEAETAAVLGCAHGTVKSRLHRALARLRERLAGDA
ncbi:MAG TPA: sigma-70 family RNA polymerase sigma factor [Thermomicrobiales bacterium]|nr:sigma-70 family RNA polymerase sigma factor [Thermomicrobiales bacterium]